VNTEKASRLILVVSFLLIAGTLTPVSAFADQLSVRPYAAYTNSERGIAIEDMVLFRNATSPSLSELKQAGFTLVGTYAEPWFDSWHWGVITNWMTSAHKLGLRTFLMIYDTPSNDVALATKAVSLGSDVLMLDELLSRYNTTRDQLRSIINAGLTAKNRLQFIVNEYVPRNIQNAYAWTSDLSSVRIATDNYDNKSIIDLDISLSANYGKKPLAWLIFAQGSQDFDCYLHLDSWLTYVKQTNINVLWWFVDAAGTWQTQWPLVIAS